MKITTSILLCLLFISCEQINTPAENRANRFFQSRQDSYPMLDSTFNVDNQIHVNIGSVRVEFIDSSIMHIFAPDSGRYTTHISLPPNLCTINGQSLIYGIPAWISISEHTLIHATWATNVVVIDRSEVN